MGEWISTGWVCGVSREPYLDVFAGAAADAPLSERGVFVVIVGGAVAVSVPLVAARRQECAESAGGSFASGRQWRADGTTVRLRELCLLEGVAGDAVATA